MRPEYVARFAWSVVWPAVVLVFARAGCLFEAVQVRVWRDYLVAWLLLAAVVGVVARIAVSGAARNDLVPVVLFV